ncbi:hypothetical protein LR48_Vigan08g086300 [Vigna angularis]|uniref:Uncharacterized protein n=1 Tax=Phaseolus angularis TaxID=3914 RepID=A0A0L9V4W0_PHAAN|nr:hypothetical protein LR48_Vigan08g086300 [Vigna angularis]
MVESRRNRRRTTDASSSSRPRLAPLMGGFRIKKNMRIMSTFGKNDESLRTYSSRAAKRTNVTQLTIWDDAIKVHLGVSDFNRLLAFQSLLRHPEQQTNRRQLLVGGFKVEEQMIHYLIVWLLCPRATNHAQCLEQDLLLLYGILNHIHIDWPALISDTMLKAKKYNSYHFPYALLISRILEYKGVSVEGELTQAIQALELRLDDDNDDMDAHMVDPVQADDPTDAGPSQMSSSSSLTMEEHFANLSKQMEDMHLAQQAHFEQIYE